MKAPITVIHRDLKSKNVVIGLGNKNSLQCKICDFGTSKDLTSSWTAPSWGGTAAWMSPEIISQREGITTATDVWSFAVVLWELFSRQVPYNGLTEFKIYSIISQHGVRLCIPDTCPEPLADLLERCWRQSPKDRPEMRSVLAVLERLSQDKDLRAECAQLIDQRNGEWNERIKEQLNELDTLKLDLARQMEDLKRREQALRKRENSHRNFLHMNVENVCEWNEDCVCEWVQNIAAAASSDFPESTVDKIISSVLQYGINGPRLMEITEKDLESLGIEPVAVRRYIILKLDKLRAMNVQLCNYPCSIESPLNNCKEKEEKENNYYCCPCSPSSLKNIEWKKEEEPIECSILLHVGMYSRTLETTKTNNFGKENNIYRFKVFLDSDWEIPPPPTTNNNNNLNQESATFIKEVNILIYSADRSIFLGPIQCICPPFGYLEWAQISRDQQYKKLPLTLTLTVSYTDQVIRPKNTQIQIRLSDLSGGPRTLCSKKVKLFLLPQQTDVYRISYSLLQKNKQKYRRNSVEGFGINNENNKSISPIRRKTKNNYLNNSSSLLLNRSPIWADLSANIRNYNSLTFPNLFKKTTEQKQINKRSISNDENNINCCCKGKINNTKNNNEKGLINLRNRCLSE
uniref:Protein kinase domain-containing protein n=1 Tax=Meloidogyne hapla TaxID=6305 RepID=A0A1I8B1R5_MELHA